MKALNLLLLMLISAVVASAQAQAPSGGGDAPGLAVVQYKWRQEVRNPALDEDPLRVNDEQQEMLRVQRETRRANAVRERQGQTPIPPPSRGHGVPSSANPEDREQNALRRAARPTDPGGPTVGYFYEVNVSNTGEKAIRALVWEYVLFDTDTKLEVGRRRFANEASIRPGKSKKIVGQSASPPASVVDVSKAGKQSRNQFTESVVILRVEYADGSAWERPAN